MPTTENKPETIRVLLLEPGQTARAVEIGTSLEELQAAVGGTIEAYYPFEEEVCIVCNDEGKITGLKPNRAIYGKDNQIVDVIAGTFFICDCSGEDFKSLSEEQLKRYTEMYRCPEAFYRINDELRAVKYDPKKEDMER